MSSGKGSNGRRFRKKGPSRAMDGYRVAYKPLADSTPEGELVALAAVYAFVIQAHEQKKAAAPAAKRRKVVNLEERRQGQDQ
jgi:hypothetical protein